LNLPTFFLKFSLVFYLKCLNEISYFCILYFTTLKKVFFRFLVLCNMLVGIMSSCSLEKFIPDSSVVVDKVGVHINNQEEYPDLAANNIIPYLQPQVGNKFFFTRIAYWVHYRYKKNPSKINKIIDKNLGSQPVYFIRGDAERNIRKIKKYLNDLGYFHSKVSYETVKNGKVVHVFYQVSPAVPYRYDSINFHFPDSVIDRFVTKDLKNSLIHKGDIYNAYTLDAERDRITNELRNHGYYYFNRNYIQYVLDTNSNKRRVHVLVDIKAREIPDIRHPGKMIDQPHLRCLVNKVFVVPDFNPLQSNTPDTLKHTILFKGDTNNYRYYFLCHTPARFNLSTFDNAIRLGPGRSYADNEVQQTYQKLFNYPILRTVNITFDSLRSAGRQDKNILWLNAYIRMQTTKLNTVSLETMGTNSSGDLGVNGLLSFTNRNVFKRAEVLRLRLMGGFEAQNLGVLSSDSSTVVPISSSGLFNTFEAGIDVTVFFPMALFPFQNIRLPGNPQTNMGLGYNFQRRPYYSRNITNIELGYSWSQTHTIKHVLTPLNINFVRVNPSAVFRNILDNETNQRLKEQYSNHMIVGLKYSFIFNNQKAHHMGNFNFIRLNFESSGNLLNGINKLAGSRRTLEGFYNILGVRYSQYVRLSSDYRHYIHFDKEGTALVIRSLLGLAIPYGNSNDVPYEKGFYAGGANGMRGWRFRTLGPGSFQGQDAYERIGEIQLEGNMEFRFPVYQFVKAAFFVDAGNIWNYYPTATYPQGNFRWNRFGNEIAVDAGVGIRLDFSYFIFRLDAAVPLHDPAFPMGKRWVVNQLSWHDVVGNFGIGYPF